MSQVCPSCGAAVVDQLCTSAGTRLVRGCRLSYGFHGFGHFSICGRTQAGPLDGRAARWFSVSERELDVSNYDIEFFATTLKIL